LTAVIAVGRPDWQT